MPTIEFTANLRRHVECPKATVEADTLAGGLADYFRRWPDVRGFILDDQGAVRHHVKILIDGHNVSDRKKLSDRLEASSQIHVFQALSGG